MDNLSDSKIDEGERTRARPRLTLSEILLAPQPCSRGRRSCSVPGHLRGQDGHELSPAGLRGALARPRAPCASVPYHTIRATERPCVAAAASLRLPRSRRPHVCAVAMGALWTVHHTSFRRTPGLRPAFERRNANCIDHSLYLATRAPCLRHRSPCPPSHGSPNRDNGCLPTRTRPHFSVPQNGEVGTACLGGGSVAITYRADCDLCYLSHAAFETGTGAHRATTQPENDVRRGPVAAVSSRGARTALC